MTTDMSMIFRFRMLSDENDYFIREYEVPYDMGLVDFNDFLCDDLHFDKNGVTSFFTSNALWEKGREFTREDMDGAAESDEAPVPMADMVLGQIIRRNRDRLIFLFDVFGDRGLFLELTEAKKSEEGVEYPRITLSRADAPKQYDAGDNLVFNDMMSDFDSFESYETDSFEDY